MSKQRTLPGTDHPRQSDEGGVNPSGLGPAQPILVDNDHDQVPTKSDREHLSEDERLDLSQTAERERDVGVQEPFKSRQVDAETAQ